MVRPVRLDQPTAGTLASRGMLGFAGTVSQGLLRFLTAALVGRIAGPPALGNYQSALSLVMLLALLWPTTAGSAASKYLAGARGAGDLAEAGAVARLLSRRTVQSALGIAAIAVLAWWWRSGIGGVVPPLAIAGLALAYSGYCFSRGVQYGAGQVWRGTMWDIVSSAIGLALTIVLLVLGARGLELLFPFVLCYGLYSFAGWPHLAKGELQPLLRREIDGFVALGALGSLASAGFLQLSMIVAAQVSDQAGAGHYAAALALATPASLLAGSLSLVLFPSMAEAWGRGDVSGFRAQTSAATSMLITVSVAVLGAVALAGRLIVQLIWGPRFAEAAHLLPVLLFAVLMSTVAVASVNAITTVGKTGIRITTGASILGLVTGVVVWLVVAGRLGPLGVAVGYAAGAAVTTLTVVTVAWRRDQHSWAGLVVRLVAAIAVVAGGCVLSAQQQWNAAVQTAVAVVFLIGWLALSRRDTNRLLALVRRA